MRKLVTSCLSEFGEPTQVLGYGGKRELLLSATRATQPKSTEPQDALQVGETHLDALAVVPGLLEGVGAGKRSSNIAGMWWATSLAQSCLVTRVPPQKGRTS
jgi:hypothetical protein